MTVTIPIEIDEATKLKLEQRATQRGLSLNEFVRDMLERSSDDWAGEFSSEGLAAIERGRAEISAGHGIPHGRVQEWAMSLGTSKQLPRPE